MTVPDVNQLEALPSLSTTEFGSLGGALHDHRCDSSRGTSTSRHRDSPVWGVPASSTRIAQAQDQDQDLSNAGVPVQVPLLFPTGSSLEPAIMEMASTEASRLSSRMSEERRRVAQDQDQDLSTVNILDSSSPSSGPRPLQEDGLIRHEECHDDFKATKTGGHCRTTVLNIIVKPRDLDSSPRNGLTHRPGGS